MKEFLVKPYNLGWQSGYGEGIYIEGEIGIFIMDSDLILFKVDNNGKFPIVGDVIETTSDEDLINILKSKLGLKVIYSNISRSGLSGSIKILLPYDRYFDKKVYYVDSYRYDVSMYYRTFNVCFINEDEYMIIHDRVKNYYFGKLQDFKTDRKFKVIYAINRENILIKEFPIYSPPNTFKPLRFIPKIFKDIPTNIYKPYAIEIYPNIWRIRNRNNIELNLEADINDIKKLIKNKDILPLHIIDYC